MYSPKLYLWDRWIFLSLIASLVALVYIWLNIITHIKPGLDPIFLHYNILFGVDLTGDWWKIYYLPIGGLAILLINYPLSFILYRDQRFWARLFVVATTLMEFLLAISVYFIVGLNS